MKRMVDKSKFSGIKLLGEYRFVSVGSKWAVYKQNESGDYVFMFYTSKIARESNINLYNSVADK